MQIANFIAFHLRSPGSQSDGGFFKNGSLERLCKSTLFPAPSKLGQRISPVPYFLLGDDAFSLDINLMELFPHRTAIGDGKVVLTLVQLKENFYHLSLVSSHLSYASEIWVISHALLI